MPNQKPLQGCKYIQTAAFNGADNIQVSSTDLYASAVKLFGYQGTNTNVPPTLNAAPAYAGWVGIGEAGPRLTDQIPANTEGLLIEVPPGSFVNLRDLYVFGDASDAVLVQYVPKAGHTVNIA